MTTIDMTPTDEGFANIASMFAESILSDVRKARKDASRELLVSLIETTGYLAARSRADLVQRILRDIREDNISRLSPPRSLRHVHRYTTATEE